MKDRGALAEHEAEHRREDDDVRAVRCEHCQGEGRIYRDVPRHWGVDPETVDCGECPVCEGTCLELIEVEPVEEEEIMR